MNRKFNKTAGFFVWHCKVTLIEIFPPNCYHITMRKLILIAHISLDGFVAGPQGELDGFERGEENLEYVCKLTEEADSAMFGRVSYELLESFWPGAKDLPNATKAEILYSTWYNNANKIIISKTMFGKGLKNTDVIGKNISDEITQIKKQKGKDILIFGSPSVSQSLLQMDLIDNLWIFINPVIFGTGIPLFGGVNIYSRLKLINSREFSNGEVALHYLAGKQR